MYKIFIISQISLAILLSQELITPIPQTIEYHHKKALLGQKLFYDVRLSKNDTISCASCHFINDDGDDNIPLAIGVDEQIGTRNSLSVLNAIYNSRQLWDGSAKTLAEQAKKSIYNPVEMNSNFKEIILKLNQDKYYLNEFFKLYQDGITGLNITDAISEFEKTLTTPNSKFDKYLRGDENILSCNELKGYQLFKEYGCISCHNGKNIGGNLMQKIGVIEKFATDDFGQFHITQNKDDKYYLKVPSLRNIELTAPYFHNGTVKTLRDAVTKMMKHQVGYILEDREIQQIVAFLKTLTGDTPTTIKEFHE